MFVGFNLSLHEDDGLASLIFEYINAGKELYKDQKGKIHNVLSRYINIDGSLSATKLEDDWFAHIPANVFLSHSHADRDLAIGIAGYLKEKCGITCFIDSCVWGYANDLLRQIDNRYCKTIRNADGSYSYDYNLRNQSTSHVHMLLNGALAKMIDGTECLIFLNTPNSIKVNDTIIGVKTASPWIYGEILMATTFPHRKLYNYRRKQRRDNTNIFESKGVQIEYDVNVEELIKLDLGDIEKAKRQCEKISFATVLDQLYRNKGLLLDNN